MYSVVEGKCHKSWVRIFLLLEEHRSFYSNFNNGDGGRIFFY